MKNTLILLCCLLPTVCLAGEFEVGRLSLSPCSKVEYQQQTVFPGFKIGVPEVRQAPQTVRISAYVEGAGVDSPTNAEVVKACVASASELGVVVMASDTAGASPLFKERLISCLKTRAPSIRVDVVFLKSESRCDW